jgi:hypothetical protein
MARQSELQVLCQEFLAQAVDITGVFRAKGAPDNCQCQHDGSVSGQRQIKPAESAHLRSCEKRNAWRSER